MKKRLVLLVAFVSSLAIVPSWIGWRIVSYDTHTPTGTFDCAIVLGAAVVNGQPSPVFKARLDHGLDLYATGKVAKLVTTGGVGEGDTISEGEAGAQYLAKRGIPQVDIITEKTSKTTFQNLAEVKPLMEQQNLSSALVVSDQLHLRRSVIIAKSLEIDAYPSSTPYSLYKTSKSRNPFLWREIYFSIHFRLFHQ